MNVFFKRFYREAASALAAPEDTAQVIKPRERKRRIRWEESDTRMKREPERRLPYMVFSQAIELGVDIADLDLVHLRNVPPTPANYSQRSGRACRQGQPGLVFTFFGAFNGRHQYYFRRREEMVASSVRPPRMDLANEVLVRAHVQAVWPSQARLPLHKASSKCWIPSFTGCHRTPAPLGRWC